MFNAGKRPTDTIPDARARTQAVQVRTGRLGYDYGFEAAMRLKTNGMRALYVTWGRVRLFGYRLEPRRE